MDIIYITPKGGGEVVTVDSPAKVAGAVKELRERTGATEFDVTRGDVVCDFCSFPSVISIYRTKQAEAMFSEISGGELVTHMDADGLWGACPDCDAILTRMLTAMQTRDLGTITQSVIDLRERSVDRMIEGGLISMRSLADFTVRQAHNYFLGYWNRKPGSRVVTDDEIMRGGS